MRTVILASHGHLASGMKNTVEMILGEQEALKAFDAYTTPECNVHDTLEAMLRQADGECVIVTDVLGGSVNKEAVVFAAQPGVRVITGMNLGMLIEILGIRPALSSVDQLDLNELAEAAKGGIVDLAAMMEDLESSFLQE